MHSAYVQISAGQPSIGHTHEAVASTQSTSAYPDGFLSIMANAKHALMMPATGEQTPAAVKTNPIPARTLSNIYKLIQIPLFKNIFWLQGIAAFFVGVHYTIFHRSMQ